jgi:hypothetical protein
MCGEDLVYSLFSFCSNIAEYIEYSKSSNKRQNEVHEYGITDECCNKWCTGYDVLFSSKIKKVKAINLFQIFSLTRT